MPARLPIVIGLTAYGACLGLTRGCWEHGPRITLPPEVFQGTTASDARRHLPGGTRQVNDTLTHEMLHAWLHVTGQETGHKGEPWYATVRRLSPAVLSHPLDVRRGADRKSVRVPNPNWQDGGAEPKTLVRKVTVPDAVPHGDVARWPQSFRPKGYDWGAPISCPSY